MTLLRRVPREVYRVYDEQEFFAEDAREDHYQAPVPDAGVRWIYRVAGATVLLAVMGTVGGVIFIAGAPSAKGGGRRGASLIAATRAHDMFLVGVRSPRKMIVARASLRPHIAAAAARLGRAPAKGAMARASVAQAEASAPASPRQLDPPEFGFER